MLGEEFFSSLPKWQYILVGIIIDVVLIGYSYFKKALTVRGSISAIIMGFIIFYNLNMKGWMVLVMFFVLCTILGKITRRFKVQDANAIQEKGGCRDEFQVFANGGLSMIFAFLYGITHNPLLIILFSASLAESTSDTFAGEIGILSKKQPVDIITRRPVHRGISGGVTMLGNFGAILGSSIISLCWYIFWGISHPRFIQHSFLILCIIIISGFLGDCFDSVSGSTFQALYWDDVNEKFTEKPSRNGRKFQLKKGFKWANNDMVNMLSNLFAVFICSILLLIFKI